MGIIKLIKSKKQNIKIEIINLVLLKDNDL
jgi:hypothetical protein